MNKSGLIAIITFVVLLFVISKIVLQQVCSPGQNSTVINAVTQTFGSPPSEKQSSTPDPFSWDPIFNRLMAVISKACPK